MTQQKDTSTLNPARRHFMLTALASATLAACGGGGGGGGIAAIGSGGTGSYASGSISGFGSIIVNQVHYDESSASILGDDEQPLGAQSLKLGMVVEITGGEVNAAANGKRHANASNIQLRSEIEGPLTAIDTGNRTLTVLGQTVHVSTTTVFDDDLVGGFASLRAGMLVEVYGFQDAQGRYWASRIDDEESQAFYKLRGTVASLDAAAHRFAVGGITVDYSAVAAAVPAFANGSQVRVELEKTAVSGIWRARSMAVVAAAGNSQLEGYDRVDVELEGIITRFDSSTRFVVNGIEVDAGSVARLPAGLALGRRVEVEGTFSQGVLKAVEVELEDDDDADENGKFELEGSISRLNTSAQTFVVRGVTVSYATARFSDGTVAQLANGVMVEVEAYLAADGSTLVATEIEFDD